MKKMEEVARELVSLMISRLADELNKKQDDGIVDFTILHRTVVKALLQARNDALNDAEKIAKNHRCTSMDYCCCDDEIANKIAKLRKDGSK